jgi:hypothetical protein
MRTLRTTLFAAAFALSLPGAANAHLSLKAPTPRNAGIDDGYTYEGPCGPYAKTDRPTVFRPGATITVRAGVNPHTNEYRVALSPPGDHGFEQNVIGVFEAFPDEKSEVSFDVTLPDQECVGCTLQVVMWDAGWYACADVDITRSGHAGAPSGGEGSGSSSADPGSGEASEADAGGCAMGGAPDDGAPWGFAALGALWVGCRSVRRAGSRSRDRHVRGS